MASPPRYIPPGSICLKLNISTGREKEQSWMPGSSCVGSLTKSTECGCRYCHIACEVVTKDTRVKKSTKDEFEAVYRLSGLQFEHGGILDSEFFVLNSTDDPILPVSALISGHTGSEQSLQIAINWLEECLKSHNLLCQTLDHRDSPPSLPLRVIDVNLSGPRQVRLVQTNHETGYYACLSHCWGGEQPLRSTLKPDTLSSHQRGIPWEDLPRTFQDAIVVTRRIGLRFIWIDSLCIVQDDEKDWQTQSAKMGEIYQNCVVCIAGSASSGPHQGLFREADSAHIGSALSNTAALEGLDKIRNRKPLLHHTHNLPLLHRGWVFQERLLSPRYLHFGDQELIWECMERMTCECRRLSFSDPSRYGWLEPKSRFHPTSLQYMNDRRISIVWQAAIRDYSGMRFSRSSDVFPAISGLAKFFRNRTGWEYIAGMWKESLISDMVWMVQEPELSRRCAHWRAPTFSWASVTKDNQMNSETIGSPVSYGLMAVLGKGLDDPIGSRWRPNIYATIVETKCVPASNDVTGQLKSGYIILSGTLVQANIRCPIPEKRWHIAPMGREPLLSGVVHMDYSHDSGDCSMRDGDEVFCFKLIGLPSSPEHGRNEYLIYLVLKKVLPGSGEFERVGLLRDAYYDGEIQLEQDSEESAIQRDVLVKIF